MRQKQPQQAKKSFWGRCSFKQTALGNKAREPGKDAVWTALAGEAAEQSQNRTLFLLSEAFNGRNNVERCECFVRVPYYLFSLPKDCVIICRGAGRGGRD